MSKRLKNKLLLGALGIVVFVIMLSTVATSLLISNQNQRAAHKVLRQAAQVIQEDLAEQQAALLANCDQIATSPDMGDNIRFLGDEKSTAGVKDFLNATYRDVVAQLYAVCRTGHVWEAALYDRDGDLTGLVAIDTDAVLLAYPQAHGFMVARLTPEQELVDDIWHKVPELDQFQRSCQPQIAVERSVRYETAKETLCLEAHVPVMGDIFNVGTREYESDQVGFVVARRRIGDEFVARIGRITGTRVNVFARHGLAAGDVPAYSRITCPETGRPGSSEASPPEEIAFGEHTLADESFYQAVLPLAGRDHRAGAIVALYSQEIAKAASRENVRVLCLISILCILVIVPITFIFSGRLTRPIEGMVKTAEVIAAGNYDAEILLSNREDELGSLSRSFARMRDAVREHVAELAELNATLEHRVAQRTQELRKANESLLRITSAVEKCSDAIAMADSEGNHFYQNRAFTELFGYEFDEFVAGEGSAMTFTDKVLAREVFGEIMAGNVWSGETIMAARDGRRVPILLRANAIRDERGEIVGLIGIHTDITERKRAEEQLQQAKDVAEAATRAKGEFLANMSHEIRTPMTAILGFADVLLEQGNLKNACPEMVDAAETIKRNGEHLLSIINDILDLSKVEAGKMNVECVPCQPCALIAELASLVRIKADGKGLSFNVRYGGAIPTTIRTDPTRLRQILINIVGNAIKFTETGSVTLTTRFRADLDGPIMEFDIVDTGLGMTAEQRTRLFRPFTQADASTTRRFGGTGLGLAISKRFAEMLGGDIVVVSSELGVGTHFRVTVATGDLDGVAMTHDPLSATTITPATPAMNVDQAKLRGCRILLAEDGPDNQRLISHVLRKAGADVTVTENGKLAVDAALAAQGDDPGVRSFDVILMDMQMPVMDGYKATSSLRREGYCGPIIALTAHAMEGDCQKCVDAGCDAYVAKPINRRKLVDTILQHVHPAVSAR